MMSAQGASLILEPIKENEMNKNLLRTIFNSVAIIGLNIVNPLILTGATSLFGIGVAALGIANLQKE
jgi:hypothetical protein